MLLPGNLVVIWYKERWCKGTSWYEVWLEYDKHGNGYNIDTACSECKGIKYWWEIGDMTNPLQQKETSNGWDNSNR